MKVLVADASTEERERVADALGELTFFDIEGAAANLEGALRSLAGSAPDLVVTEACFPDGDGVGLIQAARRHAAAPAVVVFSAAESAELRKRCLDAGADLYVDKAVGVVELQRLVQELADDRRSARRAATAANSIGPVTLTGEANAASAAQGANEAGAKDRFSVIGRIAGGVAHDLSNYFAVADLSLQGLRRRLPPSDLPELDDARSAIAAATRLTKSLLDYARGGAPAPAAVDLPALVRRTLELMGRLIPPDVALHLDLEEPLPRVTGVAIELEQLLLNLLLNACDAMPEGGELWLSLRWSSPGAVTLEVSDSGTGMSVEASRGTGPTSRSSKPERHGEGLGLGIVRSVVERHGATLLMGPRSGGGTRVLVRLSAG